ncbi:hypothetical protein EVAR_48722_1, partial [Eumeta japonica]
VAVSELKPVRKTKFRARAGSKIENETWVKIECGIGIRIESLIGIEIQKTKELFAPGFVEIGTVINNGIRIDSENEIKNATGVQNECGNGIRVISVTGIGIESETRFEIDID